MTLLSICIPAYNGGKYIGENLSRLSSQFGEVQSGEVEILVCDDGSKDNTVEVVQNYASRFPNIQLLRNEKNLGFDRNVDKVLSAGSGQFRWLLSQDEFVEPGSLKFLLSVLKNHPSAAYIAISDEPGKELVEFKNGSEFLKVLGLKGGLLSQNIFNAKFLPTDRQQYYGNLWFHYSLALEVMATHPALLIKNIFAATDHTPAWAKGGLAIRTFTNLKNIVAHLPKLGYKPKTISGLQKDFARQLPRTLASAKLNGLKVSWNNFWLLITQWWNRPLALLASLVIFFCPLYLLKNIKTILFNPKQSF